MLAALRSEAANQHHRVAAAETAQMGQVCGWPSLLGKGSSLIVDAGRRDGTSRS
jgi:hypothetical protein